MKIGLKIWSTNDYYIEEIIKLYNKKYFDYIELFTVPDSYKEYIGFWKNLDIKYIVHAPHYNFGFNLSLKEKYRNNIKMYEETQRFADKLDSEFIIIHGGTEGTVEQTIDQINRINDNRMVIENKPKIALNGEYCIGSTVEEINKIKKNCSIEFCFDIGHAIYAANYYKKNIIKYIEKFENVNKPVMYHISNGNIHNVKDEHKNLNDGNFDLKRIFKIIKNGKYLAFETPKNSKINLNTFIKDYNYFRNITDAE